MASPQSSSTKPARDQYHHVIPRFILREFQIGPKKTKRERNLDYRKFGFVDEKVWFYDIEKHSLEQRMISGVYGVTNLYRDAKTEDVDELEKKLSVLENTSARILRDLQDSILDRPQNTGQARFSINRGDLEQLRKFLFIMHYRNAALSHSYFSADHPENAPIRERIKRMMKRLNLKSTAEMWLHWLRYYLDTLHSQIGIDAMQGMPEDSTLDECFSKALLNPDFGNFEAMSYQSHAEHYYLGIVQAASGEEFVLASNSFGLWEGIMPGSTGIHRLYVISPQIALILRINLYRPGMPYDQSKLIAASKSDLLEIPLSAAVCSKVFDPTQTNLDFLKYKASIQAKSDQYLFPITKLSKRQTYLINSVVMLNGRPDGSLTFLTPQIMRSTVRTHWKNKNPFIRAEQPRYVPLIRRLTSTSPAITGDIAKPTTKVLRLPAPRNMHHHGVELPSTSSAVPSQSSTSGSSAKVTSPPPVVKHPSSVNYLWPPPETAPMMGDPQKVVEKVLTDAIDRLFFNLLMAVDGTRSPVDRYNDTRTFWSACENTSHILTSHKFISGYKRVLVEMIRRYTSMMGPGLPRLTPPLPNAKLAEKLDQNNAAFLFVTMRKLTDKLKISRDVTDTQASVLEQFYRHKWVAVERDVVSLGFLLWMAKNNYDHLTVLKLQWICVS